MKTCTVCRENKPDEQFTVNCAKTGSRRSSCNACRRVPRHFDPTPLLYPGPGEERIANGFDWSWTMVIYRELPGFPGYCIGTDGSVWSRRSKSGQLSDRWVRLNPSRDKGGYLFLTIKKGKKSFLVRVARAVLSAFLGLPEADLVACHYPWSDPKNNSIYNLRWDSQRGNLSDRVDHGTSPVGSRHPGAILVESDIVEIRRMVQQGQPRRDLASRYGVSVCTIHDICGGRSWTHV
jgi:hypothetical protein